MASLFSRSPASRLGPMTAARRQASHPTRRADISGRA